MRPMKKTLSTLLLLSLACSGLDSEIEGPASISGLCQNGMEAAETWQGEYPGPVVHVMETARLPSRFEPCGVIQGECTVPAGLYHPWATGALGFATVRPILKYRVTKDYTDEEGTAFAEGDIVEVTAYLGEGFCGLRINGENEGGYCPGMFDESAFVLLNPEDESRPETQLFKARCADGVEAWVEVGSALAAPGVEEGVIVGYGEVAPYGTAEGF
ncbi:MAG: hypothetical protein ACI8RZ_000919 [Myxococcota bacterium]|jgi:hypothetical protein